MNDIFTQTQQNPSLRYDPATIKSYLASGGTLSNGAIPTTTYPEAKVVSSPPGIGTTAPAPLQPSTQYQPPAPQPTTLSQDQTKASNQGKPGYDVFGNPVSGSNTSTSTTNTTKTTTSGDEDLLKQKQAELEAEGQRVISQITNIQNGTIPLTDSENAQINNLKLQFQTLIDEQNRVNQSASNVANIRGYEQGSAEYDPTFQTKIIGGIMSAGAAKVADLNTKMAAAVAAMTQSFKDHDILAVKDAWDIYQDTAKNRIDALQKTVEQTQKVITETQEKNNQAQRDQAIADYIVDSGETDPVSILNAMKTRGYGDVTFKDVSTVTDYYKTADKSIPGIVGEWMAAKQNDPTLKDVSLIDYMRMKDPQSAQDFEYKSLQIAKLRKDLQDAPSGMEDVDPAQILAYANQYAATGQIPSLAQGAPKGMFGVIASVAKQLPKTQGAIVDKNTGVTSSRVSAGLQSAYGSLYSAVELAKQLKELDDQRVGGIIAGTFGKVFGSEAQQKYVDLRDQVVDLLSRARTGAAINAHEEALYGDMLPGRFSEPFGAGANSDVRIQNFIDNLSSDLLNKTSTQGLSIYGLSKVTIGGKEYTVGDTITNAKGEVGTVLPDGTIATQ